MFVVMTAAIEEPCAYNVHVDQKEWGRLIDGGWPTSPAARAMSS